VVRDEKEGRVGENGLREPLMSKRVKSDISYSALSVPFGFLPVQTPSVLILDHTDAKELGSQDGTLETEGKHLLLFETLVALRLVSD
jgi:hypothetical protein